jgi:hypothetical protein
VPHSTHRQYILDAFLAAAGRRNGSEQRLNNGLILRAQFQAMLQQKMVPTHPRFEWTRRSARTMLELLLTMAQDYDKTGSGDSASMLDLLDIAQMAAGHIGGIIQAGFMDPSKVQLQPYESVKPEVTTSAEGTSDDGAGRDDEDDGGSGEDPQEG